jgi:excinuclease UvrABC nuclease subunit
MVYVGKAKNERKRISAYASHGSHLSEIIDSYLKKGFTLFYRVQVKKSKAEAKKMQNNLLVLHKYDWNI